MNNCNKRYEIGGSHSGADEDYSFLVYYTVQIGACVPFYMAS